MTGRPNPGEAVSELDLGGLLDRALPLLGVITPALAESIRIAYERERETHAAVVEAARGALDHAYESGADNVCVHCGVIGSFGHLHEFRQERLAEALAALDAKP